MISLLMNLAVPVLVAIYTFNYARWAWRRELRAGAVGLGVLALLCVALPGYVLWYHS